MPFPAVLEPVLWKSFCGTKITQNIGISFWLKYSGNWRNYVTKTLIFPWNKEDANVCCKSTKKLTMCQTELYDVVGKNKNLTSLAKCKEFNPLCLQEVCYHWNRWNLRIMCFRKNLPRIPKNNGKTVHTICLLKY
jgi:hypothetical protein